MIRISEELNNFLFLNAHDIMRPLLFRGFNVLDEFSLPFYEDKYVELIHSGDYIEPMNIPVILEDYMRQDLNLIIASHKIHLHEDPLPRLETHIEIAETLLKLQRLEDYYFIERTLSTSNTNEMKLALILVNYSELDIIVCLDAIAEVSDEFFEAMLDLIKETNSEIEEISGYNPKRRLTSLFFEYIGNQDTLGKHLIEMGFTEEIEFRPLVNLIIQDIGDVMETQYKRSPAYAALDFLSLLMLCSDTREQPITAYKEYAEEFIDGDEKISVIFGILSKMYGEYLNYYRENTKGEIDENNNQERIS